MCKICVENVRKILPKIDDGQFAINRLLMGATCFPFGSPGQVESQLKELAEKTDGTLKECLDFAERELDVAMAKMKAEESVEVENKE